MSPPLEAVVFVEQGVTACAGALVDDRGTVITAYHCVAAGGRPAVTTRRGTRAIGRVEGVDRKNDLARISVPDLAGEPWMPLRTEVPRIGEEAWALGHPMGAQLPAGYLSGTLRWSASVGAVSAVGDRAVQVSAPVNPGNSGGPIVDAEGRVIGVVSRRIGGDGLGFATRADLAQSVLDAEPRRLSPLGGTVNAEVIGLLQSGVEGTFSLGGRVEASFRDRLVLSGLAAAPISSRWDAVQRGTVAWTAAETTLGLRQRFFRGQATIRADLFAGTTWRLSNTWDPDDQRLIGHDAQGALLGLRVAMPGLGLGVDLAHADYDDDTEGWRTGLSFTWPGTLWMF